MHMLRLVGSLQVPPNCTLVAYDCTSMYTNMELKELNETVNNVLCTSMYTNVELKDLNETVNDVLCTSVYTNMELKN